MPGRPAKTLQDHIRDRTFRPSRHADLLETDPLPAELAHFGDRYRAALSDRERQAVALELRDAIAQAPQDTPAKAAAQAEMEAIFNAPPEDHEPEKDRQASGRFARATYARDLYNDGLTVAEISRKLRNSPYFGNASPATVGRYLDELGVARRRGKRAR